VRRILDRAGRALKYLGNERGTLYEIPILLFLLVISLAVGSGQYGRYGWKGVLLGTVVTFAGVVGAIFALIGIVAGSARLNEKLEKHPWYLALRSLLKSTLLFLFFSIWGAALSLLFAGLFELLEMTPEWVSCPASLTLGAVWMILRHRLKGSLWPLFWRVSGLVGLGGLCVVLGMFVGPIFWDHPSTVMRFLQIVFFVPLIIYFACLLVKRGRTSGDDQGQ
jgi:hypothetical protein